MVRIVFWLVILILVALGAIWLVLSPGAVDIEWLGYQIEGLSVSLMLVATVAVFVTIVMVVAIIKWIVGRPSACNRRRERLGRDALSKGLIAIGAGDAKTALQHVRVVSKKVPGDPLAKLLDAQTALQQGDNARARKVFQDLSETPEAKLLGLHGLFEDACKREDLEAAGGFADQALADNPGVAWASNAKLSASLRDDDWPVAMQILEEQYKTGIIDKLERKQKKAIVLTAHAMSVEHQDRKTAIELSRKAHALDPSLVQAAVVAGRTLAAAGNLRKASSILSKTWKLSPHPDIGESYVHASSGNSVQGQLQRARNLLRIAPGGEDGAATLAGAAIDASDWNTARQALEPYTADQPRARICWLMARIENGEGEKDRSQEWLARAIHAPRDPTWTTDGIVSPDWSPISPKTGEFGAFEWKVPVEGPGYTEPGKDSDTFFAVVDEIKPVASGDAEEIVATDQQAQGVTPDAANDDSDTEVREDEGNTTEKTNHADKIEMPDMDETPTKND